MKKFISDSKLEEFKYFSLRPNNITDNNTTDTDNSTLIKSIKLRELERFQIESFKMGNKVIQQNITQLDKCDYLANHQQSQRSTLLGLTSPTATTATTLALNNATWSNQTAALNSSPTAAIRFNNIVNKKTSTILNEFFNDTESINAAATSSSSSSNSSVEYSSSSSSSTEFINTKSSDILKKLKSTNNSQLLNHNLSQVNSNLDSDLELDFQLNRINQNDYFELKSESLMQISFNSSFNSPLGIGLNKSINKSNYNVERDESSSSIVVSPSPRVNSNAIDAPSPTEIHSK